MDHRHEVLQGGGVGTRQIPNVDEIADGRAIRGVVIDAEHREGWPLTLCDLDREGDQVGFRIVPLAEVAIGIGTRHVEVAKGDPPDAIRHGVGLERMLNEQLRHPVRVDRKLWLTFHNRDRRRLAIGGTSRGKDDRFHTCLKHPVEQREAVDDVVPEIGLRMRDGLADVGRGGEVHHRIDLVLAEHLPQEVSIADIPQHMWPPPHGTGITGGEIVEPHWQVASGSQQLAHMAADVPGSPGYQDLHLGCPQESFEARAICPASPLGIRCP
jgi:hypothetical protein